MENFVVSARKYRPITFDTVVGQPAITTTLKNAIANKQLAQAFLFTGPRGVGKTTTARILSKTINCLNLTDTIEPCNQCENCEAFAEGRSLNIYELDAASNNSVEDIRGLVEQVRYAPQGGKYKIYIIDEVHMLSNSAFNAFLKTLEEPPSYAIFILATTEKHKVIPTILSRCQIFDFARITAKDAAAQLKYIADKEGVKYEPASLDLIGLKADGAMRDALSLFDQLVSFTGKNLTYKSVIENLHILDYDYYFRLTTHFLQHDTVHALLLFDEILRLGFDGQHFLSGLSSHLRDLLVSKDAATADLLQVTPSLIDQYKHQASMVEVMYLLKALDLLAKTEATYKQSQNQRLTIELTLLKLCAYGNQNEVAEKKNFDFQDSIVNLPFSNKDAQKINLSVAKPTVEPVLTTAGVNEPNPSDSKPLEEIKTPIPARYKKVGIKSLLHSEEKSNAVSLGQQEVRKKSFDEKGVKDAIIKYCQLHLVNKDAIRVALQQAKVTIVQHQVNVEFSNQGNILGFQEIHQHFTDIARSILENDEIIFVPVLANFDNSVKLTYTAQQRYEHMLRTNASVGKLRQRLELDLE
ncbi:MAG: hypothetical protein RIQ89_1383 [Bacteroidota bacterium]